MIKYCRVSSSVMFSMPSIKGIKPPLYLMDMNNPHEQVSSLAMLHPKKSSSLKHKQQRPMVIEHCSRAKVYSEALAVSYQLSIRHSNCTLSKFTTSSTQDIARLSQLPVPFIYSVMCNLEYCFVIMLLSC